MNKALLKARQRFKGQSAIVKDGGTFDNTPFVEGVHTFEVAESKLAQRPRKGIDIEVHYMRLRCVEGEDKNKSAFPFAPNMEELDGIIAAAANIRKILGDVVPGRLNAKQEFELDIAAFLEEFETHAHNCLGELVEARVANQRVRQDGSHLNSDGSPRQNVFINRGLGEDAIGVEREPQETRRSYEPSDNLSFAPTPRRKPVKKKSVKRKATKKKVAKKKAKRRR